MSVENDQRRIEPRGDAKKESCAFLIDVTEDEQRLASARHLLFDVEQFADQFGRTATPVGVTRDSRHTRIDGINGSTSFASFTLQRKSMADDEDL